MTGRGDRGTHWEDLGADAREHARPAVRQGRSVGSRRAIVGIRYLRRLWRRRLLVVVPAVVLAYAMAVVLALSGLVDIFRAAG